MALVVAIHRRAAADERSWVAVLRRGGVKAAHPDDGWVDRVRNRVYLAYPQFNDGLAVGDLLALGWPWHGIRVVRITGVVDRLLRYYYFEPAKHVVTIAVAPPSPPGPRGCVGS